MSELKDFCNKILPTKLAVTKDPSELKMKDILLNTTKFLDIYKKVPLSLRYYCILNDITEIPTCTCGNPVTFKKDDPKKGFAKFCSPTCSRKNKDQHKDFISFLKDKDWLYNHRVILGKSKEQIAKEINCSTPTVTKWLENHSIETRKSNVKNQKETIPEKEFLENLYFNQNKTLLEISTICNVSNVTVKKWFVHHGIPLDSHSITIRKKVQPKIQNTNISKYGVKQVFSRPDVQSKIKATFQEKYGCNYHPITNTSKAELEVLEYFNSIHPGFQKTIIHGIELDGYNQELNIAFEYCGLFWHKESIKGQKFHQKKYEICKTNNIRLLTIFEDEWLHKPLIIKKKIRHILGKSTDPTLYARKCKLKCILIEEKKSFLNQYHIQGNCNSSLNLGLLHNDDLVAVMCFLKSDLNYELTRYATKYNVVGGFSKLLEYFKRNYDWEQIVTFADLRWHTGDVYHKSGFIIDKIIRPDYSYVIKNKRYHKFNFRHDRLQKLFPDKYDPMLSERENMKKLGIDRIYDCGKIRFVLVNDKLDYVPKRFNKFVPPKKEVVDSRLKDKPLTMISEYENGSTSSLFKCSVDTCGHIWMSTLNEIFNGYGCPKCGGTLPLTKEQINERLKDRPLIMIGEYKGNNKTKTEFECLVCGYGKNGEWLTPPNGVINDNTGCPKCAKYGFDPSKPGILYYLKIAHKDRIFYKIGITNKTVKERFRKYELPMIEVVFEKIYNNGLDAYTEEQKILQEYSEYKYNDANILSSGNSEIFIKNVLENYNFRFNQSLDLE